MTPLPSELRWFPTPWHWFVHGIGLGQNPSGFDLDRAARIGAIAGAVRERYPGRFQAFVAELVEVVLAGCDPNASGRAGDACARLGELVAAIADPREHARACAAAVESLVKLGHPPAAGAALCEQLAAAIERMAALPASSERARYEHVHLLANLVLAAARVGLADRVPASVFGVGAQLLAPVEDLFYYGRGAATWETALAVVRPHGGADRSDLLRQVLERIDRALDRPRDRPSDGAHEGRDYLAFSMFLTLGAVGAAGRADLLDRERRWLDVAAADLASLEPRARSSQTLLFVALLRSLGALSRYVPDPPALVRAAAGDYLAATDGHQHDDYLRCTYLVHLARQLGCVAELPARVGQILATAWTQLGAPSPHRGTPYGSPLMFVAYVLSAVHAGGWDAAHPLWAVDLPAIVRGAKERSDDAVTLPRIGFALIDAALCLRASAGEGADLFAAAGS